MFLRILDNASILSEERGGRAITADEEILSYIHKESHYEI